MKTKVTFNLFANIFIDAGRYDDYGYHALRELFDHIQYIEEGTGVENDLDLGELVQEWSAYTREQLLSDHGDILLERFEQDEIDEMDNERLAQMFAIFTSAYCYELEDRAEYDFLIQDGMI